MPINELDPAALLRQKGGIHYSSDRRLPFLLMVTVDRSGSIV